MLGRFWIAPVGFFALQVAPIGVRTDAAGRYNIAVGTGLGGYEERSFDCAGSVLLCRWTECCGYP